MTIQFMSYLGKSCSIFTNLSINELDLPVLALLEKHMLFADDPVENAVRVLKEEPTMKLLNRIEKRYQSNALVCYAMDFVSTRCICTSKEHVQVRRITVFISINIV